MSTDRTERVLVVDRGRALAETLAAGWSEDEGPEIARLPRTTRLLSVLRDGGPWDVLVAGPSEASRTGLRRLAAARAMLPGLGILLVGDPAAAADAQALVKARPDELVRCGAGPEQLRDSIERILRERRVAAEPAAGAGRVTVVLGPSGGGGKTTAAIALADLLARSGGRTVLVDLDLQFGKAAPALHLRPSLTISELLFDERGRPHSAEAVDEALAHELPSAGGIQLLAAPRDPVEADRIGPEEVALVLQRLRVHAEHIVVDTAGGLGPDVLTALDTADAVVATAAVDVPSVAALRELLELLNQLGVPERRVHTLLTKDLPGSGLPGAAAAELLAHPVAAIVPFDVEAPRTLNEGRPVTSGDGPAAQALRSALAALLPGPLPPPEGPGEPTGVRAKVRSWLDQTFRLRAVTTEQGS